MNHPDVVPFARFLELTAEEKTTIEDHLRYCGECRDLVLFVRKTNATLQREGRIAKVAEALGINDVELKDHMKRGTSVAALIENAAKSAKDHSPAKVRTSPEDAKPIVPPRSLKVET